MKIGIIGAGNIGKVLATELVKLKHDVSIANSRGPETLTDLAKVTGAKPVTVQDAAHNNQVVIITIPFVNTKNLPKDLFQNVSEKTVIIDTGNYYPGFRDGVIVEIENGLTESEWVQQQIGRPVIKVFNNIFAASLAVSGNRSLDSAERVTLSVSGDNVHSKTIVIDLVYDLGFSAFDQGSIKDSWKHQPGSPLNCTDLKKEQVIAHLEKLPASYNQDIQKEFAADRDEQAKKYL